MRVPRHIRLAGLRAIEEKLADISTPSLGSLKAQKTKQLGAPETNMPKVVSFPSSS